MKYEKEHIEAAKLLFAEIMELNQILPEERWISFSHTGSCGQLRVIFWKTDEEGEPYFEKDGTFTVYLHKKGYVKKWGQNFSDVTAKLKEWRELFGNAEKEN